MKKHFAVALTAALVLPATPAAAQDETITIGGLVYLDRNVNRVFDEGDVVWTDGLSVRVSEHDTGRIIGDFGTDASGRYRVVVPKGPEYAVTYINQDYATNRPMYGLITESTADADFNLIGQILAGSSFVDANGDGVKQAGERTHQGRIKVVGRSRSGRAIELETQPGADGTYSFDLPDGDFTITAPDLTAEGLALAPPRTPHDIDWLTGSHKLQQIWDEDRTDRLDLRYLEAKADIGLESAVTPVRDVYTIGDQLDLKLTLTNHGNVPVAPTFFLGSFAAKLLSHSENVTLRPGTDEDFTVNAKILPGQQVDVALRIELTDVEYTEVHALVRFNFGRLPDVGQQNNVAVKTIKVVARPTTGPGTTTEPTATTTTAAPTSTTDQAVAKAGNGSGLASTGASPLGFLGLGALLLAAGVGALFVARRRRS
ncbi:hypothetical protein SAMN05216553_102128 [Lentzea fradiae]|uniref:Gram-positive cocci surface proteins LPxTG domain-containing protein n=1 Tax=Lentzea fradiae TaxID=200378 RepID=A0A1G7M6U4_9PSEU|nr:hypothetical protein [Lentzea fradiae]SDF57384.1 hypothetical protein SAMN05216553_102128 [Lentzea fradiae]